MPAIRTLSITQQRIVLVVLLLAIGASAWWQNGHGSVDHPVQTVTPTLVPNDAAEIDFAIPEAAWSTLKFDGSGNLQVDELTETALLEAADLIRDRTSELRLARMALLLEKQFGPTASRQVMELLPKLKNYKEAERRWMAENAGRNPLPHAELFRLQDEWLGATLAKKMFARQRRLAEMMVASHRIRNDAGLTQAEKDQALRVLRREFQEKGTPIE